MALSNIRKFFNSSITIMRQENARDAFGGFTSTWVKKDWSVLCRIYGMVGQLRKVFAGQEYMVTHRFVCEANDDVKLGDKIDDGTRRYLVIYLYKVAVQKRTHHVEALLVELAE